jgi:hypothetical protein
MGARLAFGQSLLAFGQSLLAFGQSLLAFGGDTARGSSSSARALFKRMGAETLLARVGNELQAIAWRSPAAVLLYR